MKTPRGLGSVYQPTYRDKNTGEVKKQAVYWIQYCRNGRVIRESSESSNEKGAWKLLKRRHGEIAAGKPVGPDVNRTTFEDMAAMVINDYKANGYTSLNRQEDAINHLREFFGEYRAIEITSDRVTAYVALRHGQKAANSTVNNELAALSRMFTLAMRAGKAAGKPYIGKLEANNARKGFFERDQFEAVLKHLPEYLKPVAEAAYITGWRVHDELLTRERKHVDLKAGWLRLEPGETKNRDGRNFPLTPRLRQVLQAQTERTEALQRAEGKIIPQLFHREGKPIKSFRRAWLTALVKAGFGTEIRDARGKLVKKVANRIPHDFRRTAIRNLERAGVSRSDAMNMVGHKTEAIYRRYAISDEKSLKEAGAKLAMLETGFDKVIDKVRS
ncbi:MAG TPA: tyrosine-type recombinase/integrase [Candidatus Binatia bacterium]|nr:tyrosine-type recombinase/integrase [Candidatus Binatia bacterium]